MPTHSSYALCKTSIKVAINPTLVTTVWTRRHRMATEEGAGSAANSAVSLKLHRSERSTIMSSPPSLQSSPRKCGTSSSTYRKPVRHAQATANGHAVQSNDTYSCSSIPRNSVTTSCPRCWGEWVNYWERPLQTPTVLSSESCFSNVYPQMYAWCWPQSTRVRAWRRLQSWPNRIVDTSPPTVAPATPARDAIGSLRSEVDLLTKLVTTLRRELLLLPSPRRVQPRSQTSPPGTRLCWYHARFRDARNCTPPCSQSANF